MGGLQVGDGEAQVAFGGGEAAVAEHLLDVAHVGVVLDEVGGAGVPPGVAGHGLVHAGGAGVFADEGVEGVGVDLPAGATHK